MQILYNNLALDENNSISFDWWKCQLQFNSNARQLTKIYHDDVESI